MLKLYWTDANDWTLPDSLPLSEYRRQKIAGLKHREQRLSSLCAEALLIEALRREGFNADLPLRIETEGNGKPYLTDGGYYFNLSHSSHYAACAIADHPVGLDVQLLSSCREELVRRFFTNSEQKYVLTAENRDEAFTRLWCRKESFLKAIGLGLRRELSSFDLSDPVPSPEEAGIPYSLREYRTDSLFFCICAPRDELKNDDPISLIRLP